MDENIKKNEEKTVEAPDLERVAEIIIDDNMVSVPLSHFEELVAAKVKLEIVGRMVKKAKSYSWDDYLEVILGDAEEGEGEADA